MPQVFANNAKSFLSADITNSQLDLNVLTGEGTKFPVLAAGDWFFATLTQGGVETSWEIIKVTARTSDYFTIERAQQGTSADAWIGGCKVELRWTRDSIAPEVRVGGYFPFPNSSGNLIQTGGGKFLRTGVLTDEHVYGDSQTVGDEVASVTNIGNALTALGSAPNYTWHLVKGVSTYALYSNTSALGSYYTSANLITWTARSTNIANSNGNCQMVWDGTKFRLVTGLYKYYYNGAAWVYAYGEIFGESADGITWTLATRAVDSVPSWHFEQTNAGGNYKRIIYKYSKWWIVTTEGVRWSTDWITWTLIPLTNMNLVNGTGGFVESGNTLLVFSGGSGSYNWIYYHRTVDGVTWTQYLHPVFTASVRYYTNAETNNYHSWVTVGNASGFLIISKGLLTTYCRSSVDGITWNNVTLPLDYSVKKKFLARVGAANDNEMTILLYINGLPGNAGFLTTRDLGVTWEFKEMPEYSISAGIMLEPIENNVGFYYFDDRLGTEGLVSVHKYGYALTANMYGDPLARYQDPDNKQSRYYLRIA